MELWLSHQYWAFYLLALGYICHHEGVSQEWVKPFFKARVPIQIAFSNPCFFGSGSNSKTLDD